MYSLYEKRFHGSEISFRATLKNVAAVLISAFFVVTHPLLAYSQTSTVAPETSEATSGSTSRSTPTAARRAMGGGNNVSLSDYSKCIESCKKAGTPEQVNTCMEGCRSIDSKLLTGPSSGVSTKK